MSIIVILKTLIILQYKLTTDYYNSNLAHYVPSYGPFHFYSATKHAVRALTEGLRQELRELKSPIRVTCISPGLVKTSIFKNSLGDNFDKHLYEAYPSITPVDIASTIEFILATPSHVQVCLIYYYFCFNSNLHHV